MIREFFLGFIRLHLIHHAAEGKIFGLEMIRELARHGYDLSPGTIYPILHNLEKEGYLDSVKEVVNGKIRKYYTATEKGRAALAEAVDKTAELLAEINVKNNG